MTDSTIAVPVPGELRPEDGTQRDTGGFGVLPEGWAMTVGLEVHVELTTRTKMWCGCSTEFGGEPNTNVCPVCTGQPGALPVVNAQAVEDAALLGLALNGSIAEVCRFHRKNYFYPDMAKNYQISQYDVPLVHDGYLEVTVPAGSGEGGAAARSTTVGIERLHMEEDTGKSLHVGATGRLHGADRSLIDYNRCGIPLLEVVSRPHVHDPETAQAYLRELQAIVLAVGVSDAAMDQGSMRCDANVSVARPGDPLGTRCEIKNLNSVRSLGRAIAYEAARQVAVLEDGGTITMETRHWDEGARGDRDAPEEGVGHRLPLLPRPGPRRDRVARGLGRRHPGAAARAAGRDACPPRGDRGPRRSRPPSSSAATSSPCTTTPSPPAPTRRPRPTGSPAT